MKTCVFNVFLSCLVLGCSTAAQEQAQKIDTRIREVMAKFDVCKNAAKRNAAGKKLKPILLMYRETEHKRLKKLRLSRTLKTKEAEALLRYNAASDECRQRAVQRLSTLHPKLVEAFTKTSAESEGLIIDLVRGDVSIGEANEEILEIGRRSNGYWKSAMTSIRQQLQQSHKDELEARRVALRRLESWQQRRATLYQLRTLNASIRAPEYTTCHYVGVSIQCVTE